MLLALALACAQTDYALDVQSDVDEPLDDYGGPEIQMRVEAALQRGGWGGEVTRCQVQVAFALLGEETHGAGSGTRIEMPEGPGCVHTWIRDPDEPAEEWQDNWSIEGSLTGPDSIWLTRSIGDDLELVRVETEDHEARYELPDCTVDGFPFGEIMGLEIPFIDTDVDAVPTFTLDAVLAIGAGMQLLAPVADESEMLLHSASDDLVIEWAYEHDSPTMTGDVLDPVERVFLRNYVRGEQREFEALACSPQESGELVIPAEDLALFYANTIDEPELYAVGAQLDAITESPEFSTPWGQVVSFRATVTEGGSIDLQAAL